MTIADNDNVVIAHVDCTAGDNVNRALCDGQGVNGFPTLNIYKDGVKVFLFQNDFFISVEVICFLDWWI